MQSNLYNLENYGEPVATCQPATTFEQFKFELIYYCKHENKPPEIEALGRRIKLAGVEHEAAHIRAFIGLSALGRAALAQLGAEQKPSLTSPEQFFFIGGRVLGDKPLVRTVKSYLKDAATVQASDAGLFVWKATKGAREYAQVKHDIEVGSFHLEQPPIYIRCGEWTSSLIVRIYVHKDTPNAKPYALQIHKAMSKDAYGTLADDKGHDAPADTVTSLGVIPSINTLDAVPHVTFWDLPPEDQTKMLHSWNDERRTQGEVAEDIAVSPKALRRILNDCGIKWIRRPGESRKREGRKDRPFAHYKNI